MRDRDDRLVKLFLDPSNFASRVREITREGSRYNLNAFSTLNNPLIAIGFLQSHYRDRFHFIAGQNDRKVGSDVWTLQFREFRTPTILKANANNDLPARGNYWIDMASGRVVKSELQVGPTGIHATRITTLFGSTTGCRRPCLSRCRSSTPISAGRPARRPTRVSGASTSRRPGRSCVDHQNTPPDLLTTANTAGAEAFGSLSL